MIREWIPHGVLRCCNVLLGRTIKFRGSYASWEEAKKNSSGYDSEKILDKVKKAVLEVKAGRAVYERDTIIFHEEQYSFPLVTCLMKVATRRGGRLTVLDYGGSLGSTYYQNRNMFSELDSLIWCIVEQQNYVKCGQEYIQEDNLRFFSTIQECLNYARPDIVLFSSVLQYLEKPYEVLGEVMEAGIEYILIDRTPCHPGNNDEITVQIVPKSIYKASYPAWIFNCKKLVSFMKGYDLLYEFDAADGTIKSGGHIASYKGFFLGKNIS